MLSGLLVVFLNVTGDQKKKSAAKKSSLSASTRVSASVARAVEPREPFRPVERAGGRRSKSITNDMAMRMSNVAVFVVPAAVVFSLDDVYLVVELSLVLVFAFSTAVLAANRCVKHASATRERTINKSITSQAVIICGLMHADEGQTRFQIRSAYRVRPPRPSRCGAYRKSGSS
jgi:hypothetical protein